MQEILFDQKKLTPKHTYAYQCHAEFVDILSNVISKTNAVDVQVSPMAYVLLLHGSKNNTNQNSVFVANGEHSLDICKGTLQGLPINLNSELLDVVLITGDINTRIVLKNISFN